VVASDCTLEGRVTIGEGSVLHPRCRIVAGPGCSVTIGRYNIVEELAVISAGAGGGSGGGDQKESVVLVIGDNNLFEVGCGT
jgi:dynactin-6